MHDLRRSFTSRRREQTRPAPQPARRDGTTTIAEKTSFATLRGKFSDLLSEHAVDSATQSDVPPQPELKRRASKSTSVALDLPTLERKPSIIERASSCISRIHLLPRHRWPRKQSDPHGSSSGTSDRTLVHRDRAASHGNLLTPTDKLSDATHQYQEGESLGQGGFLIPAPGAAARASAASANQIKARSRSRGRTADGRSSRVVDSDRESGISLLPDSPNPPSIEDSFEEIVKQEPPSPTRDPRTDPLSVLPYELGLHVLSFLDSPALENASLVSKTWAAAASDQQVWKKAFLDKFVGPWPPGSHPLPIGGQGIGKSLQSGQDWRSMHKARVRIEENWRLATTPENFQTQPRCHTVHIFGHTDSVYCVQFDERKIVTGSRDRTIRVWDIETYKCIKIIGCPEAILTERRNAQLMCRAPMLKGLPSTSNSTEANDVPDDSVWHIPSDYHTASILCMQYDSEIAVTGSSDSTLIIWDIETWQPIRRLRRHRHGVLDLAFDMEKIVSCSKDYTLCIWDRKTGDILSQLAGHQGPVNAVQLRGNLLVSASGEGTATLWNLNFNRAPARDDQPFGYATVNAAVVRHFSSRDRGLACVEFSDDAKYVLAGGNDQVIFKYDASTGSCIETIDGHRNLVRSLYLDGINKRVISGSYDMSVRVWDWATGEETCRFPEWATSWILSAKSDYRRIVSTSQDGRVLIFDFGHKVKGVELLKSV